MLSLTMPKMLHTISKKLIMKSENTAILDVRSNDVYNSKYKIKTTLPGQDLLGYSSQTQ